MDIKETPFKLTFKQKVVIPVEIGQTLECVLNFLKEANNWIQANKIDFFERG